MSRCAAGLTRAMNLRSALTTGAGVCLSLPWIRLIFSSAYRVTWIRWAAWLRLWSSLSGTLRLSNALILDKSHISANDRVNGLVHG